jgi:hypothetical protein
MISRCLFALGLTALAVVSAVAEPIDHLKPWDEGTQDPSFAAFRKKLQAIVARKDYSGLKKCLARDVLNNFGGGKGIEAFESAWKPKDSHSAVWPAMAGVLQLGGYFDDKTTFSAPYVYAAWPDDLDSFNFVAVTNPQAVIRKTADAKAPVVKKLDHDLLEVIQSQGMPQHEASADDWEEVKDRKGNRGFIQVRDVRSPLDFRATFQKRNGKWVVASFVSGE